MKKFLALISVFLVVVCFTGARAINPEDKANCPKGQKNRVQQFAEKKIKYRLLNENSLSGLPECLDPGMIGATYVACYKKDLKKKIIVVGFYSYGTRPGYDDKKNCTDKVAGCEDGSCDTYPDKLLKRE